MFYPGGIGLTVVLYSFQSTVSATKSIKKHTLDLEDKHIFTHHIFTHHVLAQNDAVPQQVWSERG